MESEDKVAEQENGEVESMDEAAAGDAENGDAESDDADVQGSQSEEEDEDKAVQEKPKLGLLDQPLVLDGRRKKHSVQRLQLLSPDREKKKMEFEEGKGIPLGQIEGIELAFQKNKSEELKIIHRLAFGRPGQSYEVKRNLRLFSGYSFDKSDDQYERKRAALAKYPVEVIRQTCEQLSLARSGKKEDLVDRIMEFMLEPSEAAATGRKATPAKRKRSSSGSTSKSAGKSPKKRSKEVADSDSEDEDESPKKKKKTKEATPTNKGKAAVKTKTAKPTGSAKRKQSTPKKTVKVATLASDSDSSDDEPLSKKFSTFPSDEDLAAVCESMLEEADLASVTVKSICVKVYEKFAGHDLSTKKDYLKKTIKDLYENMV